MPTRHAERTWLIPRVAARCPSILTAGPQPSTQPTTYTDGTAQLQKAAPAHPRAAQDLSLILMRFLSFSVPDAAHPGEGEAGRKGNTIYMHEFTHSV